MEPRVPLHRVNQQAKFIGVGLCVEVETQKLALSPGAESSNHCALGSKAPHSSWGQETRGDLDRCRLSSTVRIRAIRGLGSRPKPSSEADVLQLAEPILCKIYELRK